MAKATKTIEIDRSPQACYDVITDFENYPEFLDEVKGVHVLESSGDRWRVKYTIQVVKKVDYTLDHQGIPGKELSWSLLEGFFKSNSGKWVLEGLDGGRRTKVTYNIDVELGMFVPGKIVGSLTEKSLPKMLQAVKSRVEALHSI